MRKSASLPGDKEPMEDWSPSVIAPEDVAARIT